MDSQIGHSILMLVFSGILVFLNGFFVLSEFSIVKIRRSRLEELVKSGRPDAKLALDMTHKLDSYLSATQLGVTLSSLALGWIGEPAFAYLLEYLFGNFFGNNTFLLHSVSFIVAFTVITLLHVVLGELVPKSIAIAKTEGAVLKIAAPLHFFWIISYPLIKLFDMLSSFFLKRMGIQPSSGNETAHSEEELKFIVGESVKGGVLDSVEEEIIKNAVDFSDTTAKEIMTPRKDIICLSTDSSYEENLNIVKTSNYTRYPYCDGGKDAIVGMIHIRDLFENEIAENPCHELSKLVREMIIVPETASISDILAKMNRRQIHTALVLDEYGGTAGILTMEDIIEEIMGDISDEHDLKVVEYVKIDDNTFDFDGMASLEDSGDRIGINYEDEEQVTIGGYVFNLLGRLPVAGDKTEDNNCEYEVLEIDGARVKKVRVIIKNINSEEESKE
ncbi:MAG: hemolysin family protein [Mucispirillum sp.]|nr:hemolysin family protein [Mucispirillum sp.]